MKKTKRLRLAATALLLATTITAGADYVSLTVKETAGTWTSFGLKGLKVTFSADNITVSNNEMTQTYPVGDVYSLLLTDLPTAVSNATDSQQSRAIIHTDKGRVSISAKTGTQARIYNAYGQLCTSLRISQEGTPVSIGNLPPGIYLLKADNETRKFLVK